MGPVHGGTAEYVIACAEGLGKRTGSGSDVEELQGRGASSSSDSALCGDTRATEALVTGLAGVLVNGVVREIENLRTVDSPLFARGKTPRGGGRRSLRQVNVPVKCGDVEVVTEDMLVGDSDAVVVIPQQRARGALDTLRSMPILEKDFFLQISETVSQAQILALQKECECPDEGFLDDHGPEGKAK